MYRDCTSCEFGDHSGHIASEPVGRNDANICECRGNCAERLRRREEDNRVRRERQLQAKLQDARRLLEQHGYTVTEPAAEPAADMLGDRAC